MSDNSIKDQEYNEISPSGYNYGKNPKAWHPFWSKISSIVNTIFRATVDDKTGEPSVDVVDSGNEVTFNFHGLKGEKGDLPVDGYVQDVSVDDNKLTVTKGDGTSTEHEITDNGIVEVKDSVDVQSEYETHTLTETQNDGTENEVGTWTIASRPITSIRFTDFFSLDIRYPKGGVHEHFISEKTFQLSLDIEQVISILQISLTIDDRTKNIIILYNPHTVNSYSLTYTATGGYSYYLSFDVSPRYITGWVGINSPVAPSSITGTVTQYKFSDIVTGTTQTAKAVLSDVNSSLWDD